MRRGTMAAVLVLGFVASAVAQGPAKKDDDPFRAIKARLVGPMAGGRVSRAAGVPGDPSTAYLGAASGGVWKTADSGLSWKPIFDDQPTSSIGALAIAPSDANVIYVGSGEANIRGNVAPGNGIYVSTNAGKTWKHVWKREKTQIGQIAVHPKNADIAFAAVLGSAFGPSEERGVYRTTDGGKTWTQVLKKDADTGAIDVVVDPKNPRNVFAAFWQARRTPWSLTSGGPGSGIYRSEDGGDTWKKLGPDVPAEPGKEESGLPKGIWGRVGLAIAPSNPDRVFALIEAEDGGLFRSDDGGDTWSNACKHRAIRSRPWYFSTLTVDPTNADVVWVCNVRLLRSRDGGATFHNVKGPHHVDHHDLWIDPTNPSRIIDSNDGGVSLTSNGGETWTWPPLPICQFYHVSADASVPYRVLGNMQDQGTASGPSNSLSSAGVSLSDWHTVGGGETGYSVSDPRDPNIVYAGEYAGIVTRYDHRTRQARNVSSYPVNTSGKGAEDLKFRFQWTAPLALSPHDPDQITHAANVIFRSRDRGQTWQAISPDLTTNDRSKQKWSGGPITGDNTSAEYYCTVFAFCESPVKRGVLWAGSDDGLVHVSRDDGKTWTNVTKNLAGLPRWGTVCCLEPSRRDPGTVYAIVDAHRLDDNRPYLWRTTDFGVTWQSLAGRLPANDYLRVIREDSDDPRVLYLGSENGLSFSRDDGETWTRLKLGLPTVAVSDLVVKDGDLVVGTSGRSVWIVDDLAALKRWDAKAAAEPRLFPIRPAVRWRYHGESYAGEDRMSGDNPPKGAVVTYHLPTAPKEDISLEILDATGAVVRRLTSKKEEPDHKDTDPDPPWSIYKATVLSKEPGVQRVAWDLAYAGPRIIPGAKNDAGIPYRGHLAPPGKYVARLTVDGKTLSEPFEVKPDPRTPYVAADLDVAHRLALAIRADLTTLSEIVVGIRSLRAQLVERQQRFEGDKKLAPLAQSAKAIEKRLDAFEAILHNPDAEITYDILARKGGAKLYSQLGWIYDLAKDNDGPTPQGLREVSAEASAEIACHAKTWRELLDGDVATFNRAVRDAEFPAVAPLRLADPTSPERLMKRRR